MVTRVNVDNLEEYLLSLPANTPETPYELDVYGLTNEKISTSDTFGYSFITNALNNAERYVSLNESEGSITANNANKGLFFCHYLVSISGDFSSIINADTMFGSCNSLTKVTSASFSNVTNASSMFVKCRLLSKIEDTSFINVINAESMFQGCNSLTKVTSASFSNVTNAWQMFYDCLNLTELLNTSFDSINIERYDSIVRMFALCSSLTRITCDDLDNKLNIIRILKDDITELPTIIDPLEVVFPDINKIDVYNVQAYLTECTNENTPETPYELDVYGLTNATLKKDIVNPKLKSVINNALQLAERYVSLNESEGSITATDGKNGFYQCPYLVSVSGDFTSIISAESMFFECTSLYSLDNLSFNNLSNAISMFQNCSALIEIDTSSFNNVTDASYMFYGCSALTEIDTSSFVTVTNTESMFQNCSALTEIDIFTFDNVINANSMFSGCVTLANIFNWKLDSNQTTYNNIIDNCASLENIYVPYEESEKTLNLITLDISNDNVVLTIADLSKDYSERKTLNLTLSDFKEIVVNNIIDELCVDSNITNEDIEKMFKYKYQWSDESVLDPEKSNMVLWAKDPKQVISNIVFMTDDDFDYIFNN